MKENDYSTMIDVFLDMDWVVSILVADGSGTNVAYSSSRNRWRRQIARLVLQISIDGSRTMSRISARQPVRPWIWTLDFERQMQ